MASKVVFISYVIIFCSVCACGSANRIKAKDFLGPPDDKMLRMVSHDGLSLTIGAVQDKRDGVRIIEEVYNYEEMHLPRWAPKSSRYEFQLVAEGHRLSKVSIDEKWVLLDLEKDEWPVMLKEAVVQNKSSSKDPDSAYTWRSIEGSCWKSKMYKKFFLGEERIMIEVTCRPSSPSSDNLKNTSHRITIVRGLRPLQLDSYQDFYLDEKP